MQLNEVHQSNSPPPEFILLIVTHLFNAFGGHKVDDLSRHAEVLGGHVAQGDPVLSEKSSQRMHSAPMFQIAYHCNLKCNKLEMKHQNLALFKHCNQSNTVAFCLVMPVAQKLHTSAPSGNLNKLTA